MLSAIINRHRTNCMMASRLKLSNLSFAMQVDEPVNQHDLLPLINILRKK